MKGAAFPLRFDDKKTKAAIESLARKNSRSTNKEILNAIKEKIARSKDNNKK